jgi:phosphoribosylanthranilate isomerase
MKVKVCGITRLDQMQQLQDLGVDYAGMIFYTKSKRCVGEEIFEQKNEIRSLGIKRIGVFVNQDYETIISSIKAFDLYGVQLHGDETDEFCLELMDKVKVIKVFRLDENQNVDELVQPFTEVCHYFLFDTATQEYGGSGKKFNWEILKKAQINKPFFLSGGVGLEDIEAIKEFNHPHLFAVDTNSRLEESPGIKNMDKVQLFIQKIGHG